MCVYRSNDGICEKYSDNKVLSYCVEGPCEDEVMTNADKIRNMTDEELATWLIYGESDNCECCDYEFKNCEGENCYRSMIRWLKQQAKGE